MLTYHIFFFKISIVNIIWCKQQKSHSDITGDIILYLVCFHRLALHVKIPDLQCQIVSGHHVTPIVTKLDIRDGWDDFREEGSCAGVLRFLKHYKNKQVRNWLKQDKGASVLIIQHRQPPPPKKKILKEWDYYSTEVAFIAFVEAAVGKVFDHTTVDFIFVRNCKTWEDNKWIMTLTFGVLVTKSRRPHVTKPYWAFTAAIHKRVTLQRMKLWCCDHLRQLLHVSWLDINDVWERSVVKN